MRWSDLVETSADGAPAYEAQLRVSCGDQADAEALRRALGIEADDPLPRADVTVLADEAAATRFIITIRAEEPAYFRAALNSYLKWLQVADAGLALTRARDQDDA